MTSRLRILAMVAAGALAVSACDDPNEDILRNEVIADTLTVFALTGTPPAFPAAYNASIGAVTRADGNFNFDIAFDLEGASRVVIYPQRLVGIPGNPLIASKPVGLQKLTVPFDQLTRAPSSGFAFDSALVLAPGEGAVMQVQDIVTCQFQFSTVLYTKFVIDSVDVQRRAIYFRAVHDPNCGFRSLVPGETPRN